MAVMLPIYLVLGDDHDHHDGDHDDDTLRSGLDFTKSRADD